MRVIVKNMNDNFIHSITPRKARLLLKEKKAVIESSKPFTIRLLFSVSECGLKDSELLNEFNTDFSKSEKDNIMYNDTKETEELHRAYGDYIQPSLNVIMANPKNKRIKWCSKVDHENSAELFMQALYDACTALCQQTNGRYFGNFVHVGKTGFEILQRLDPKRFYKIDNWIGVDGAIKVHYITTMPENKFIVSINNKYFNDRDKFIVGSIVDEDCFEKNESEDTIKQQSLSDNNKHEKDSTTREYKSCKYNSKTHLIFGSAACGKTTMFKQLIQEKLNRDEDVFVLGSYEYGRIYFNDKSNKQLHFYSPKDVSGISNKVDPKNLAEYIVNFYCSVSCKDSPRTIAIDGLDQFELSQDYTLSEYFRELSKECKDNDINFLYVLRPSPLNKNETAYCRLPEIYERFSDIITTLR